MTKRSSGIACPCMSLHGEETYRGAGCSRLIRGCMRNMKKLVFMGEREARAGVAGRDLVWAGWQLGDALKVMGDNRGVGRVTTLEIRGGIAYAGDLNSSPAGPFLWQVIPRLEEVYDIVMISDGQFAADFFGHIKVLGFSGYGYLNELAVFPFSFLRRFYNLEMLEVGGCNFKELSPYEVDVGEEKDETCVLPKLKKLKLEWLFKITHLWKQDSHMDHICASLETLEVWFCFSLINLAPSPSSFQNLTTLDVWLCGGMTELIAFSKAQSLVCLVTMRIRECKMMTEIVASEGNH
ncbi:hypothetical protein CRYUN_Cryun40dG0038500 [Craigia yunnanensis]